MVVPEYAFLPSGFKHGVDRESMLNAIARPLGALDHPNVEVRLVIGFNVDGHAIEVACNYVDRVIFHAMKTRRPLKGRCRE
ncbi:MAG: hypothetical protein LBK95_12020 [Bifidobacteriaceae bacterium]|jgi:hypothetical protein|nr:hypothetical protein [Bifidobacteriaceae bacterium]